ncbi:hypothetical protein YP76_09920 [Sphingobium chungbukense]|uniref:Uncharacterized protein n=1 Tax=Sphingobium chungbukense TaxID=56193 RepID=A0A0M3AUL6_9SPHN|nr:hypothetical protein YP76_09920 [Sphingobium chungbukense]
MEYYDAAGVLVASVTTKVFKILGSVSINSASNPSGSITNTDFALGDADFFFAAIGGAWGSFPTISISGNTISWSNPKSTTWSGTLVYGFW